MNDPHSRLQLLNDPEFKEMARRKHLVTTALTILTLLVYYGFILLIAFRRDFFGEKFTDNIPLGMPIGVGVIVISFILTGIYVRWANTRYDPLVESMKRKAGGGGT